MTPLKQTQLQCLFSLRASLLTLAILTLLSFTYLSLKYSTPSPQVSKVSVTHLNDVGRTRTQEQRQQEEVDMGEELSDVYHSPRVFNLNFAEMQKNFKVYIYPHGDPNTFYQTPRKLTGKYASEGYFFQNIRESHFRTENPDEAQLFFIPISCHKMRGKAFPLPPFSAIFVVV